MLLLNQIIFWLQVKHAFLKFMKCYFILKCSVILIGDDILE
jgi:hypothetical protein